MDKISNLSVFGRIWICQDNKNHKACQYGIFAIIKYAHILVCALVLCLLGYANTYGQNYRKWEKDPEKLIENLFAQQESPANYEDIYEQLLLYYSNPLDLNTASREDLSSLYVLSELQINNFFLHKLTNGPLLSIYELQAIEGFDLETVYKLVSFVKVSDMGLASDNRPFLKRLATEPNNSLIMRLSFQGENQKGYTAPDTNAQGNLNQRYLGSPYKLFTRYRVQHSQDFSIGFTAEKDPGEQFVWRPKTKQYGFDFYSAHVMIENRKRLKKLVVGDYQLSFGQGLCLASGFAVGKGAETVSTLRRSTLGIRPYTSVLEGTFFRGVAATFELHPRLNLTTFGSYKAVDGNSLANQAIADSLLDENQVDQNTEFFVSSINITGFHRTPNELARKQGLTERSFGSNLHYQSLNRNLEAGFTAFNTSYNGQVNPVPRSYNQFAFSGSNSTNMSGYYSYNYQNFNFFGELASSQNGGFATVNGFLASLSNKVDMSMLYRNYSPAYQAIYSNGFGEGTRNNNEKGLYWGIKIRPNRRWQLSAYYDRFTFPWLSFLADAPVRGDEYLLRLTWQPSRTAYIYAQYRVENKDRNLSDNTTPFNVLVPQQRHNWIVQANYKIARNFDFKSRIQGGQFQQNKGLKTYGYALIQDATLDLGKVSLSGRMALFSTDDYDTRQYAYEKNVLYAFAIPAYNGKGTRKYLIVNVNITKKLEFWARVSRTLYEDNRKVIGSGLEQIRGNKDTEYVFQFRYKFV